MFRMLVHTFHSSMQRGSALFIRDTGLLTCGPIAGSTAFILYRLERFNHRTCGVKSGATRSDRKTGGVINNQFYRFLE